MSEYVPMNDTGCDVSPSCLSCPLPECKFENPAYTPHQSDKHRLYAGVYAARLAGETVNGLAERFGISSRTVSRIIAVKGVFGGRKFESDEPESSSRVTPRDLAGLTQDGFADYSDSALPADYPGDEPDLSASVEMTNSARRSPAIKERKPLPAYGETHDVTFRGGATAVYQKMCPRDGCDGDVHYQPGQLNCLQCGWVLYSS